MLFRITSLSNTHWYRLSSDSHLLNHKINATHSNILAWKSHRERSLVGYSSWSSKESDTTQWLNNQHHHQISQPGWLTNSRNSFLIVLEAKKPEMKVQADSLLMKALLSACRQLLSLCVLTWWWERDRESALKYFFIRTLILPDQGPTLMIPLDLNYLLSGPIVK